LWHPDQVCKADGNPYRVFTPFYQRGCLNQPPPRKPLPRPFSVSFISLKKYDAFDLNRLFPIPLLRQDLLDQLSVSEEFALKKLNSFLDHVASYGMQRDCPGISGTSGLSADIHFGVISPQQIWWAVKDCGPSEGGRIFLSELGWREFSYYLLYHFPFIVSENLNKRFDAFPWCDDQSFREAWQDGLTGYPLVDAGMRQLKKTGYMHNRVRMVAGSFLVKNLLQDWRFGSAWFTKSLCDADIASNSCGWQWVAGSGADAAPYFRVFNPTRQAHDHDPKGFYIREYIPELNCLPLPYLFEPWTAPDEVLLDAGIVLGRDYPKPIVDLKASRMLALQAYKQMKKD
jgi:deoxyribodipyrimidine photo-lyase